MAQAELARCISNVVYNSDFRQSVDIDRKQRSWGSNFSTGAHSLSAFRKSSGRTVRASSRVVNKKNRHGIRCASSSVSTPEAENIETRLKPWDPDLLDSANAGAGIEFKLSDFELCSHVSVGLAGRGDEVLFEGVVRNPQSPLVGMRVVLRQLASRRAQRWGQRALKVLSRILPREDLHLSYATRVHGYIRASVTTDQSATLTLVHGYNGSYSLHQWLHSEDWLTELETKLSVDEGNARRIGDDRTGGPAVSRQLRLVRIVMRDLLIGVNYLHSRGYAHTQLRLQNLQVSEDDRRVKVGLLGNAAAFPGNRNEVSTTVSTSASKMNATRQNMIAYDVRCVGYIMAKIVLRELMDPSTFALLKNFLSQGHDPFGLREFFICIMNKGSPSDNAGIQLLDRDGGAGWHLLAVMLAIKPTDRVSCKEALRHPFLCGPMWRVAPSVEMTRWNIGSTTVRIVEEYIYGPQQRNRLAKLVDTLERMNPNSSAKEWEKLVGGRWRHLYHTGRHIGLSRRTASPTVLINSLTLSFEKSDSVLSIVGEVAFTVMSPKRWPHDKSGTNGTLKMRSPIDSVSDGERLYITDAHPGESQGSVPTTSKFGVKLQIAGREKASENQRRARQLSPTESDGTSLPIVRIVPTDELEIAMTLDKSLGASDPENIINEVRRQIPPEMFDLTGLVCATYIDNRLMVLRGITGSACLFTRSPVVNKVELLN